MRLNKSWLILLVVSLGVMIPFIYPYVTLDPSKSRIAITSAAIQYPVLVAHIILAFIALITGFLQFVKYFRHQKPKIHRSIGKIYAWSVLISGLFAFILFFYAESFTQASAFLTLDILWMLTTWKGYRMTIKKQFSDHRRWMIRSFGFTLVAVCARVMMPVILLVYVTFYRFHLPMGIRGMIESALNINIWVGMMINIIIVEWFIIKLSAHKHTNGR